MLGTSGPRRAASEDDIVATPWMPTYNSSFFCGLLGDGVLDCVRRTCDVVHHTLVAACGDSCGLGAHLEASQSIGTPELPRPRAAIEGELLGKLLTPEKLEETVAASRRSQAPPRTDFLSQLARVVYGPGSTSASSPSKSQSSYRPPRVTGTDADAATSSSTRPAASARQHSPPPQPGRVVLTLAHTGELGLRLAKREPGEGPSVTHVDSDSPAYRAGVVPGMRLHTVGLADGNLYLMKHRTRAEMVRLLKGSRGSKVLIFSKP